MKQLTLPEKCAISRLLDEIKDGSLQCILRATIFGAEDIRGVIKHERPHMNETDLDKLFKTA